MGLYYIYNYVMRTDLEFDMLKKSYEREIQEDRIITLYVNEKVKEKPDHIIRYEEEITYYIVASCNSIYVETNNLELIFLSLFGIPMSTYCLLKGGIMVHCNALVHNNSLICFAGNKGMGKTTLSLFLKNKYDIFSDDCLVLDNIKNDVFGYCATDYMKVCEDAYIRWINDGKYDEFKNMYANKAIIRYEKKKNRILPVRKLFCVLRGNKELCTVEKIECSVTKKILLIQTIVGKDYISRNIMDTFKDSKLFNLILKEVDFYILRLPPLENYNDRMMEAISEMLKEE